MANDITRNDYLIDLLTLQQDGSQSISAPTNWINQEPLLEVSTELDDIIKELGETIIKGNNQNDVARWHFFIGSPGNGKSAAMGKLCRYLLKNHRCRIMDEQGCPIQELDENAVPYALYVYEDNKKYISALIVQDASVVRNPFSPDVDPARELIITIRYAWSKGISLIICTNRGVLEKAHRDNHMNGDVNKEPWFKILTHVVKSDPAIIRELQGEWEFQGNKTIFSKVKITYSHLDNRSLLIGTDIFDRLIQKAVSPSIWEICNACLTNGFCPLKANRDWLNDLDGRRKFLNILRRAEVFSGQVIVFREAVALISLLLAGCPRDYENIHPCSWVAEKARKGELFTLATRRIYISLFSPFAPFGLELDCSLRKRQVEALQCLQAKIHDFKQEFKASLEAVIQGKHPSTDVGVTRLLGEGGILSQIDPCQDSLPAKFYETWDSEYDLIIESDNPMITSIERRCAEIWAFLEQAMELIPKHMVPEAHWALRRWSSSFMMHFGALIEGRTAWSKELDQFLKILEIVVKPLQERTIEEKRVIRDLNEQLEILLDTGTATCKELGSLQLSENVVLSGGWVKDKLKPHVVENEQPGSLSLSIGFDGGEKATLGASTFLWLNRRAHSGLDPRCLPSEFLTGAVDARIRAASKGEYAFVDDDVELIITADNGDVFYLSRIDGEVEVRHERNPV